METDNSTNLAILQLVDTEIEQAGATAKQWVEYLQGLLASGKATPETLVEAVINIDQCVQQLARNEELQAAIIAGQFETMDKLAEENDILQDQLMDAEDRFETEIEETVVAQVEEVIADKEGYFRDAQIAYWAKRIAEDGYQTIADEFTSLAGGILSEARQDADFYNGYLKDLPAEE
jgi:hypothetical protein